MDFSEAGRGPRGAAGPAADPTPDPLRRLARDWAAIWQSEWAALGADPEMQLILETVFACWLRAGAGDAARSYRDLAPGRPRPDAAPRTAPAAAAADPRDAELAALRCRLAELERRLDGLDRGAGKPGSGG